MSSVFVVTPTYCTAENCRLPLLLQTLYSVQQQTHKDYLHVVVDDGSTDETPEVLQRLEEADPKLVVFRKENGGSSAAINYGVEQALGLARPDYITVCHSDDLLMPTSLEVRVRAAEESGAEFVYTDFVVIREQSLVPWIRRAKEHATSNALFEGLLQRQRIPYSTLLWRTDFFRKTLRGFDPRITSSEDWDIALRAAKELASMNRAPAVCHEVTVAKRLHANGLQTENHRNGTKERCYALILQKHLAGGEYEAAMAKKWRKIRRPHPLMKTAKKLLLPRFLRRNPNKQPTPRRRKQPIEPRMATFVDEAQRIDLDRLLNGYRTSTSLL